MSNVSTTSTRLGSLRKWLARGRAVNSDLAATASPEAQAVLEKASELTAHPREMVVPELAPQSHELEQLAPAPDQASEAGPASRGWIARVLRKKKDAHRKDDTQLSAAHVQMHRPIRLLIGYISDVSERDARFYATGVAGKNVESEYISYLGLFRYKTGYAYEIQEGGHGRSYLEPLVRYYEGLPPGRVDKETAVFIATAQRMVQIEKSAEGGLVCVQLPETYKATETDWLLPTKKLKLLRDLNTGFMMAAGAFLGVALIALIAAYATRYQPYEAPPLPTQDKVSVADLPSQHWADVTATAHDRYVKTWKYAQGKWQQPETKLMQEPASTPTALPGAPLEMVTGAPSKIPSAVGPAPSRDKHPVSAP